MRSTKLSLALLALIAALSVAVGCSSGDDDDNSTPDASTNNTPDASTNNTPDAATNNDNGLFAVCNGSTMCPDTTLTPLCLSAPGAANGTCTFECATDRQVTTSDTGGISLSQIPNEDHAKCDAAFNGNAGVAVCGSIFEATPDASGGFQPNTTYTIKAACALFCDTNMMCPTGFTCNTSTGGCDRN